MAEKTRFLAPLTDDQFNDRLNNRIPENTQAKNKWTRDLYNAWKDERDKRPETFSDVNYPIPDLNQYAMDDSKKLDFWFSRFITEVTKVDGSTYPPETLTQISAGLQRILRDLCTKPVHMLRNGEFKLFKEALDSRRKLLYASGIGIKHNQAETLTEEDENRLWNSGTFDISTSQGLSYIVYFYNCKMFGLKAHEEHASLEVEQFRLNNINGIKYLSFYGRPSKTFAGNFHLIKPKVIEQKEDPTNPRCIVRCFEIYMTHIPESGRFYRKPITNIFYIQFSANPIGLNTLKGYMASMCRDAGMTIKKRGDAGEGRYITAQSGKSTLCTSLKRKEFDDQANTSKSDHNSTDVRNYKRLCDREDLMTDISHGLLTPKLEPETSTFTSFTPIAESISDSEESGILEIKVPKEIKKVILIKHDGKKQILEM